MTSDHRVAGSSPPGCRLSLGGDLQTILIQKDPLESELLAKVLPLFRRTPLAIVHSRRGHFNRATLSHLYRGAFGNLNDAGVTVYPEEFFQANPNCLFPSTKSAPAA